MASGSCRYFSGGEKARLALAIIVWQKPNLLLLDEPTNHLDLEMCQALTVALQGFEGALIVVSHDRHLLRNTVDDLLLVHAGRATPYDGDLDDYRRWLLSRAAEPSNTPTATAQASDAKTQDKKQARQDAAAARARQAPLRKQIKSLESDMEKAQQQLSTLEEKLTDSSLYEAANKVRLQELLKQQGDLRQSLEQQEEAWLLAQEELEQAQ